MFDWNNNDKCDMEDEFIDYQIYSSITDNERNRSSSGDSGDMITVIGIVLLVLGILMIFL